MRNFNERLLKERERLGLKKGGMASAGGVANSTYTKYEDGSRLPDVAFLSAIAAQGADIQYILTGIPGYKIGPPGVLETYRQQAYIEAVEKGERAGKNPQSLTAKPPLQSSKSHKVQAGNTPEKQGNSVVNQSLNKKPLTNGKSPTVGDLELSAAAEDRAEYNASAGISLDEYQLLAYYRQCAADAKKVIVEMARVSSVSK